MNIFIVLCAIICSIHFCFGPVEMRQFKNNYSGLKIDWVYICPPPPPPPPPGAAIYGMRITSLHFVVLHNVLQTRPTNAVLIMALSQARNLLRRNNLSGDLTDDCVNNFMSFFE